MRSRVRFGAVATSIVLAAGVFAACGDDDDDDATVAESSEAATEVTVTAVEYSFDVSATPTAETTEITLDNAGEEAHELIFARINEGFTTEEAIEMEGQKGSAELIGQTDAKPGEQSTLKIKKPIEPGPYAMLCAFRSKEGPHYELGQLEEFPIE